MGATKTVAADLFDRETDPKASIESVMAAQSHETRMAIARTEARIAAGTPTDALISQGGFKNPDGTYTAKREALHRDVIGKLLSPEAIAAATPASGQKPTFTILGGRGGSGKTWFTREGGPVKGKPIVFDNDKIKSMLPEYQGWNAALVHEEASHIFNLADNAARAMGLNVVHDATMKTAKNSEAFIEAYVRSGYQVEGYYMFVPPEIAAQRAIDRFRTRGRFVPPGYVMASRGNEKSFDQVKGSFAKWGLYNNNVPRGTPPQLVASGAAG